MEGAVYEEGIDALKTGRPRLLHFGVADETAWSVGLACGGQIDVFVQPLKAETFQLRRERLETGQPFAAVTVIRGPAELLGCEILVTKPGAVSGHLGEGLDDLAAAVAGEALASGGSQIASLRVVGNAPGAVAEPAQPSVGEQEQVTPEVFIEVAEPQPVLVIVGAVHSAIALSRIAQVMGFHTVVVDPRKAFGNSGRFPHIDRLMQAWPDDAFSDLEITSKTAIAVLTHDPKIDDPALHIALASPAFYIGALGSPTTQAKRRERLLEAGISAEQLARLHGPIGLKLGGRTPEEIALSVMAEIVAVKNQVIK